MTKDRSLSTAIHIMMNLAYQSERLVSSEELALGLKTNPGLVRRILSKLSSAGLIETVKGKNGGSRLARSASSIYLNEVYLAVHEGPLFGSFDKDPYKSCPVSCKMSGILRNLYDDLEDGLVKNMNKIKISELVNKV